MPVSNFAPELIALYREGSQRSVEIEGLTYGEAVKLRHRMNALRTAMRRENHELLPAAERCVNRLASRPGSDPEDRDDLKWSLIVEPADADIAARLREQGIKVTDIDLSAPPTLSPSAAGGAPVGDKSAVADAVHKFLKQGSKPPKES